MNVAIIPARGGSKRVPRKNIKNFHGKPIIAYSIEAALKSQCFERIIVSTDDQEIADIAKEYGAEVPFKRPSNVSDDYATTIDVVINAINELHLVDTDIICCLYATAPFVKSSNIVKGLNLLKEDRLDYVISVTEYSFPIQRALKLDPGGIVKMFQQEYFNTRSQDLEKSYHDAGQFYWGTCDAFLARKPFFSSHAKPVILPMIEVQDIDTPDDWKRAELIYKIQKIERQK